MRHCSRAALAALMVAASPASAFAHVGAGDTHGFLHGFAHPVGGLDHVLAMVAVGIFAAFLGGRALWAVPLAFVSMMILGGVAGVGGGAEGNVVAEGTTADAFGSVPVWAGEPGIERDFVHPLAVAAQQVLAVGMYPVRKMQHIPSDVAGTPPRLPPTAGSIVVPSARG